MHRPIAMRVFCAYKTVYPTLWIWNIIYMILLIKCLLLITTAHQRCLTSLAVSDKRIPEWFSVICRPQNWGLVCWEAMPGVKSGVLCVVAVQCSCSCCTVHFHPSLAAWKPRQCTSAWRHWLKLTQGVRDMFIRAWGMSMSWGSISLKRGQQPAELHWSVARSFSSVSQSQEQILNICFSVTHDFWSVRYCCYEQTDLYFFFTRLGELDNLLRFCCKLTSVSVCQNLSKYNVVWQSYCKK